MNTALPDDLGPLHAEFPAALMWQPPGVRGATVGTPGAATGPRAGQVRPEDVTDVILTPIVRCTTATLDVFPNATIHVSKRGWVHFHTTRAHPHDHRWAFSPDTLAGIVAIISTFFLYETMEGGVPLGLDESLEEMHATNARVLRSAAHIVPLYDPSSFERYPDGLIAPPPK